MKNDVTTTKQPKLLSKFADKFGVDEGKLMDTLKATCFKSKNAVTNQEMMALLIVADQYGLNPFTKEIFAFPDGNKGIVPVVGVDGWSRIINNHKSLDGFEFRYSETMTTPKDGKECPTWCEVVIYRKDREHPTVVREYLDEVYREKMGTYAGPWQSHTKRFLRHKVLIQGARLAFGFGGIYDEDEAASFIDITPEQEPKPRPKQSDFEPEQKPVIELLPFRNEFDDFLGDYAKADFVLRISEGIKRTESLDFLTALMEYNEDSIESLGTRTEERKEVSEAFNASKARIRSMELDAATTPSRTPAELAGVDWDVVKKQFLDAVACCANSDMLASLQQSDRGMLDELRALDPDSHSLLMQAVLKRAATIKKSRG